ncbi:Bardet-Biedl syndrome 1 protein homolog [Copidosoma floridanum]|uniref:Bardet-Biedl syndrome 1 protein homolog n=1 Tax=Copidosoma floridanum TaxID=29053 RepID=UPI0006C9BC4B|nr:Bardet-Biedl syndrome 1 protein homolog [Copidosoma floridanum]
MYQVNVNENLKNSDGLQEWLRKQRHIQGALNIYVDEFHYVNDNVQSLIKDNRDICIIETTGSKQWKIKLPGNALDMASFEVSKVELTLTVISVTEKRVLIYNNQNLMETIMTKDSISSIKCGGLGEEKQVIVMISHNGGLVTKTLNQTANFGIHSTIDLQQSMSVGSKLILPKKTRLFIEQTIRERSNAINMHTDFQQRFLKIRLLTIQKCLKSDFCRPKLKIFHTSVEACLLGLGPDYNLTISVSVITKSLLSSSLYLLCKYKNTVVEPKVTKLQNLSYNIPSMFQFHITTKCKSGTPNKIQVLLCCRGLSEPFNVIPIVIPL